MNKKLLKKLINASLIEDNLDEKKIEYISSKLNREDLKIFINELKKQVKKTTIYVETAYPLTNKEPYLKEITNLFPNKKIEFRVNPSLILSVKIINNNNVFDINMNNLLNKIEHHVGGGI